jgi:hypothetical protein
VRRINPNRPWSMPYTFQFDRENKIVLARFEGRVTDDSLAEFYRVGARSIVATMEFRGTIIDFSDVIAFDVSAETVRALAWEEPVDPDSSKPRVMVAPEAHIFGLCRVFSSHGEDTRPNLHVVRSREHAYAILSVSKPKFEPVAELDRAAD